MLSAGWVGHISLSQKRAYDQRVRVSFLTTFKETDCQPSQCGLTAKLSHFYEPIKLQIEIQKTSVTCCFGYFDCTGVHFFVWIKCSSVGVPCGLRLNIFRSVSLSDLTRTERDT